MKILQVCSAEELGGGERHVIDLTRALIERGHELHLATRKANKLQAELQNLPIVWHKVGLRNALDWFSALKLTRIIGERQIEIIHAHVARDYPVCGIAAKLTEAGLFITRHHFNPFKANFLYRWALNDLRNFIAVSDSVKEKLLQAFPMHADRIVVIPNWLDSRSTKFLSREEARSILGINHPLTVALIGQITALKRQDLFIQAVKLITPSADRVSFFIVGKADVQERGYEQDLRDLVNVLGLENKIRFTGFIENLPQYLPAFDLVVAPSDNEGFSLVLIEAMAAGCAVIAANSGGMAEIIEDNISGRLFKPGDAQDLADQMSALLTDQQALQEFSKAGQLRVSQRYEREATIDRIEALYRQAMS